MKRLRGSQSEAFISTVKWFLSPKIVRKCFCKETKRFSRQKVQKLFIWASQSPGQGWRELVTKHSCLRKTSKRKQTTGRDQARPV